jgi:hypothetical protein
MISDSGFHTHPTLRQASTEEGNGVVNDGDLNKFAMSEHTLVERHASAELDDSAAYCSAVRSIKDVSWVVGSTTK